ncbi:MAG TPA: NAD-dependent epimerase/dehydratase family protein [Nitrospiria bacterium]|nr:NAD-dependent epimerase/dehydratase family protein [Nitrospiria bacterium]
MKVLVTGGAGFIGSHIVDRLVMEDNEVIVLDNLSTGKRKNIHKKAKFYKMDIVSPKIEKIFRNEKPDMVSHHAAQMDITRSLADPIFDAQVNILGTINLLDLSVKHGVRHFVFASSGGAVYGDQYQFPATEEHDTSPLNPYGISKLAGEKYLHYYRQKSGLAYTCLRYANIYGPRQDPFGESGVVSVFGHKMLRKEEVIINGNGMQSRDYLFVEDAVEAHMAALHFPNPGGEVFNVGSGGETTVNDLYKLMHELTETTGKEVFGPEKKGEQVRSSLDSTKIQKILDWEPRISLREGLIRTIEYFRKPLKK